MSLRRISFLLVGVSMLALTAVVYVTARTTIMTSFDALELQFAEQNIDRVAVAMESRIGELEITARDWAPWTETYEFLQDLNDGYVEDNLNVDTLVNLAVNGMVFIDTDGDIVYEAIVDLKEGEESELTPELRELLVSEIGPPSRFDDPGQVTSGLLDYSGGAVMVAAQPVLRSDFTGPPSGTLVVLRFLDEDEIEWISTLTRVPVRISPIGNGQVPEGLVAAGDGMTAGERPFAIDLDDDSTMSATMLWSDIRGEPALLVTADLARDVHERGHRASNVLGLSLVILGAAATLLIGMVLARYVTTPVASLSRAVTNIGRGGDPSARVNFTGTTEVRSLATSINGMLEAIEDSERELHGAREALERLVEERTADLKETVAALRESEERYRTLVQRMADAVLTFDPDGVITFANPRADQLVGRDPGALQGLDVRELISDDDLSLIRARLKGAGGSEVDGLEIEFITGSGLRVPVEVSVSSVPDPDGGSPLLQAIARDITERKRFQSELVYMASHDHLTGLVNRRRFEEELDRELAEARRRARKGAVLWFDIDHFKEINDSLGHRAGDEVLLMLAEKLERSTRSDTTMARLGGDEFALLLPGSDEVEAASAAERLLAELREHTFVVDGHPLRLSASVGIVLYPAHGTNVDELMARADLAMYHAKDAGRSRASVYTAGDQWHTELASRRSWAERIERALAEEMFVVFAQPIVDIKRGEATRYELLVRMLDDDGSIISPGEFIGVAERLGLIREIDRWMVGEAVRLLKESDNVALQLDLNLSARAFSDPEMLPFVEACLAEGEVDPARLGIELTETIIITDIVRAQEFVRTLKRLGCRFSLDDFGSGYSSFYHLKHLPIDTLKIDGSFIRQLTHSQADQHLVCAMVELAKGLGISTTAEWVEDAETLELLRGFGVHSAQGFFLGKPSPASEVLS